MFRADGVAAALLTDEVGGVAWVFFTTVTVAVTAVFGVFGFDLAIVLTPPP